MNDDQRAARAAARAHWRVRRFVLGEEPTGDLRATTTAEERIEMMWALTIDAWALAGKALPTYTREETPIVLRRGYS